MKKLTVAVLLISCFSSALGSRFPWKFGTCLRPRLSKELNTTKFFNGHWYALKTVGNYLFDSHGSCFGTEVNLRNNGQIDLLHFQFESMFSKYAYLRGTARAKFTKFMGAFFPAKYDFVAGLYQYEAPFAIVDTDYDNWAFVYFCNQYLGVKLEMAWMAGRDRTMSYLDKLEKTAVQLGMDPSTFSTQDNSDCPTGEPSL
ncbi:apolipoprotein D-like [Cimex lectularius]|uniref:Lipocalin/cytosolic fatty-acid binding domain-containing protein n=1 Tax=Cimex lectularius TaxID=79782 RepID=A0A8I6S0Y5_CIMLE|nr:apolipoprotein D-like [Cimex lectularius]